MQTHQTQQKILREFLRKQMTWMVICVGLLLLLPFSAVAGLPDNAEDWIRETMAATSTTSTNASRGSTPDTDYTEAAFSCEQVTQIPRGECDALVSLYTSTNGDQWTRREGWLDTPTPCRWSGVSCLFGHVMGLVLPQNQLNGSLPPELGDLNRLLVLFVGQNPISGSLPSELGNLTNLIYLSLAESDLSGPLPLSLSQLNRLWQFDFHATDLCEPDDPELQAWLNRVSPPGFRSGIVCASDLTITATAGEGGEIEPSGAVAVPYGNDQIFFITEETGYTLDQLLVDGTDRLDDSYQTASGTFYTFEQVITDHTIEAAFQIASATVIAPDEKEEIAPVLTLVTIRKRGTGQGTIIAEGQVCGPDCSKLVVSYMEGKRFPVTVEPAAGSFFVGWETAKGLSIEAIHYVQPDETVYAVFDQQSGQ